MIIYPYKKGLNSTSMLREAGCKVRYDTSTPRQGVATAWGNRTPPPWADKVTWINHPCAIPLVSSKINWASLCAKHGFGLAFTEDKSHAKSWASYRGVKVLCRTKINSRGGEGIVVARNSSQVVDAPLYSLYFKKNREYRVVFGSLCGSVYVATKCRPTDSGDMDRDDLLIRTADRGYVYQTDTDPLPESVIDQLNLVAPVLANLGLNLLAYDIAYNSETDKACIIEANTAWGLNEGSAKLTVMALNAIGDRIVL